MKRSEILKKFKEDLVRVINKNELNNVHNEQNRMFRRIVGRATTFQSLTMQLKNYIETQKAKKKWFFFRVGHTKSTRDIDKVVIHYSQEQRIKKLLEQIAQLKNDAQKDYNLFEQEKSRIRASMQKVICDLQKQNAELLQKYHGLLELTKKDDSEEGQRFLPELVSIVSRIDSIR